jgi:nitrite reductase/ring-hydroxylating ferredoxin subunit
MFFDAGEKLLEVGRVCANGRLQCLSSPLRTFGSILDVSKKQEIAMAQFVKVGTRAEFENLETGKLVEAGGQSIAIFNLGGNYYALENTCPHRGGPLSEGTVEAGEVICPWHGSRFDVKTGAVLAPPSRQGVKSFPVRVTGNDVEVEVG